MIDGATPYDGAAVVVWIVGSLVGGLFFLIGGARAAGLALIGSVVGAFTGFTLVSSNFDLLAIGAVLGATAGTVAFGLGGLFWKPGASRSGLVKLAAAIVVLGVLLVLVVHVGSNLTCRIGRKDHPCLRTWDGAMQGLLAFNLGVVALMSFVQSRQARDPERASPIDVTLGLESPLTPDE